MVSSVSMFVSFAAIAPLAVCIASTKGTEVVVATETTGQAQLEPGELHEDMTQHKLPLMRRESMLPEYQPTEVQAASTNTIKVINNQPLTTMQRNSSAQANTSAWKNAKLGMPKRAWFVTLADAGVQYRTENLVYDALNLICSAKTRGSRLPFHIIYGGGLKDEELTILQRFGWIVDDHTKDVDLVKDVFKPVYNSEQATQQQRQWVPSRFNDRKDGYLSYLSFFAWKATQYEQIVKSDLDVCVLQNPDPFVHNISADSIFQASPFKGDLTHDGIDSHLMVLKPSDDTFDELMRRAGTGDYYPFTNTDQDIYEKIFDPQTYATRNLHQLLSHMHVDMTHYYRPCSVKYLKTCRDFFEMCYDHNSDRAPCAPENMRHAKARGP